MKIELLAFDLDGTTLQNDHMTVSPRNLEALRAAGNSGVILVPATGRARGRLPEFLFALPNLRYLITSNGARLTDLEMEETLYESTMPFEQVQTLYRELERFPVYMELYAQGRCYADVSRVAYFQSSGVPLQRRQMMLRNRIIQEDLLGFLQDSGWRIEKLNLPFLLPEQRGPVHAVLDSFPGIAVTSSLPQNAEINAAGCNKGAALAALCQRLGMPPERVLALGDNGNDVELLRYAGTAAVPSNAADCAKEVAETLPVSNEQDAVAEAITKWLPHSFPGGA